MQISSSIATSALFNNARPLDDSASAASSMHTVQQGDALSVLARRHGVNLDDLIKANPQIVNPDLIYPDDTLRIPVTGSASNTAMRDQQADDGSGDTIRNDNVDISSDAVKLVRGASGPDVSQLQTQSQSLGYYNGEIGGNFGQKTEAAVRAFQQDNHLVVDGWAGTQVFDCSGLIVSMFKRAGIDMGYSGMNLTSSRSVVNNANGHLQNVSRDQLKRGDLIAYPGHIVMYLGDGKILEASPPGVQISNADKYWNRTDVVFRRVPL